MPIATRALYLAAAAFAIAGALGAAHVRRGEAGAHGSPKREQAQTVPRLAWLAGCWQRVNGETIVEEQWMRPRGGVMLGMSRTTRADTVVEYEHLRIFERAGRAVYAASPSGQASAEFETAATSDSIVTFENPAHDFPQRIIYRRRGADSLLARIEGVRNGQQRAVDFPYRRIAC